MSSASGTRSTSAGRTAKKHKRGTATSEAATAHAESGAHSRSPAAAAAAATVSTGHLAPRTESSKKRRTVPADRSLPPAPINRDTPQQRSQLPQSRAASNSSDNSQAATAATRPSTTAQTTNSSQRSVPAMTTGFGDLAQSSSHSETLRDMAGMSAAAASATPKQGANRRLQHTTSAARSEPRQRTMASTRLASTASDINDALQVVAENEAFTKALHSCADGQVLGPMADLLVAIGNGLTAVMESISLQGLSDYGGGSGNRIASGSTAKTKLLTGNIAEHGSPATKPEPAFVFDPNKTSIVDKFAWGTMDGLIGGSQLWPSLLAWLHTDAATSSLQQFGGYDALCNKLGLSDITQLDMDGLLPKKAAQVKIRFQNLAACCKALVMALYLDVSEKKGATPAFQDTHALFNEALTEAEASLKRTGGKHEAHAVQDISASVSDDEQQLLQARSARLVLSRSFFNCTALTAEKAGMSSTRNATAIADCAADFDASYTYCLQAITLQKVAGSRVTTSEIEEHAAARAQPLIRLWTGLMAAAFPPLSAYYKEAQGNAHTKALVYMALDAAICGRPALDRPRLAPHVLLLQKLHSSSLAKEVIDLEVDDEGRKSDQDDDSGSSSSSTGSSNDRDDTM